jgi:hypothetical protein
MSAFERTPLAIVMRDCASAVAGIALEVGIEPTARYAADLGFIPASRWSPMSRRSVA